MAHYTTLSMPKADALAVLALARAGLRGLEREATLEEKRGLESLEYTLEGRDRRSVNRFAKSPTSRKPRVGLDLRRQPRAS